MFVELSYVINYDNHEIIEAVDSDSVEMKTAELLSGVDGTMMFRYNSKRCF